MSTIFGEVQRIEEVTSIVAPNKLVKSNGKDLTLEVSYTPNQYLDELFQEVENFYSNVDFSLEIKRVDKGGVNVSLFDQGIPRYDYKTKSLHLPKLNGVVDKEVIKRITIHEVGHVLGFPDCYIEFFEEGNHESLTIYHLFRDNIMCFSSFDEMHVRIKDEININYFQK